MDVTWPLVGRRAEVEVLSAVLADTPAGGVVLAGEAGVGKTRLAREALARAEAAGWEVEWLAATRAAASIPFGVVSHLLPPAERLGDDRLETLRRAAELLAERSGGRPLLVGVDDAHQLDDASAALVHQLTFRGLAVVVATVRTGEPAPDPVIALWKDGLARRLDLSALSPSAAAELLERALGGPVDGVTKEEVLRVTGGNPLYLRELVLGGLESGALRQVDKVWRWRGRLAGATRLAELVQARLSTLEEAARVAVELVAWGEPLGVGVLERLVGKDAVQAAEDGGPLVLERSGRRALARLAHPLYGEVLRAVLSLSRVRALAERLAAALGAGPLRRRDDLLRVGAWQLEAGVATNSELLLEAARQAVARFDHELTERLARAAVDAGVARPRCESWPRPSSGRADTPRRRRSWRGSRRPRAPSRPAGQAFGPGTSIGGWSGRRRPRRSCSRPPWPRRAARKRSPCWLGSCCSTAACPRLWRWPAGSSISRRFPPRRWCGPRPRPCPP